MKSFATKCVLEPENTRLSEIRQMWEESLVHSLLHAETGEATRTLDINRTEVTKDQRRCHWTGDKSRRKADGPVKVQYTDVIYGCNIWMDGNTTENPNVVYYVLTIIAFPSYQSSCAKHDFLS